MFLLSASRMALVDSFDLTSVCRDAMKDRVSPTIFRDCTSFGLMVGALDSGDRRVFRTSSGAGLVVQERFLVDIKIISFKRPQLIGWHALQSVSDVRRL